jgi:hypothetical protein
VTPPALYQQVANRLTRKGRSHAYNVHMTEVHDRVWVACAGRPYGEGWALGLFDIERLEGVAPALVHEVPVVVVVGLGHLPWLLRVLEGLVNMHHLPPIASASMLSPTCCSNGLISVACVWY